MKGAIRFLLLSAVVSVLVSACGPGAALPTPTPIRPTPAPAAAPTKAPEPTKPPAPSPTPVPATLKYGTTVTAENIGIYVALEKGYFKEQGINLEQVVFASTPELIAPLSTGEVDVGGLVITTALLNAADRGVDLKLVAHRGATRPGFESYWVLLRKDLADSGQVKTPADLKGMKVAQLAAGSLGSQILELVLAKGGLAEKDVAEGKFELVRVSDQPTAFANKSIAASFLIDPFATTAVQQGVAVKWFAGSSLVPGNSIQASAIAYSPKMAKDTDLGRRWMVAYLKGVRDYLQLLRTEQGKGQVRASIVKYTSIKDVKLLEAMETPYLDPNGAMEMDNLKFQYDWLVKGGYYTGKTTFERLIETSFTNYALQKLGG